MAIQQGKVCIRLRRSETTLRECGNVSSHQDCSTSCNDVAVLLATQHMPTSKFQQGEPLFDDYSQKNPVADSGDSMSKWLKVWGSTLKQNPVIRRLEQETKRLQTESRSPLGSSGACLLCPCQARPSGQARNFNNRSHAQRKGASKRGQGAG